MLLKANPKVALIGNPNSGKSSLFNKLTGLNQKVGNFPGVTVEGRSGESPLNEFSTAQIIDLPGAYSLYARTPEERVVVDVLSQPEHPLFPDILVFIADATNLQRNLLLLTQIKDLGVPVVLALNMLDLATEAGIQVAIDQLRDTLEVQVVPINARSGEGIEELKYALTNPIVRRQHPFFNVNAHLQHGLLQEISEHFSLQNPYRAYQLLQQGTESPLLSDEDKTFIRSVRETYDFHAQELQARETIARYQHIQAALSSAVSQKGPAYLNQLYQTLDRFLLHPSWGHLINALVLLLVFQLVFWLGNIPLPWLDGLFASAINYLGTENWATHLLSTAILPSMAGILMFVPHILVFYILVAVLEETGYFSRTMLLMDKLMHKVGLTGRSAIPSISSAACAIPAHLAARECASWRERAKNIFLAPLLNCSSRLPIYIILIALFIPSVSFLGIFSLQGLTLMGMYLVSFLIAITSSWMLQLLIKAKQEDPFMMELPYFTKPYWQDILYIVKDNMRVFLRHALRVSLPVALVCWGLFQLAPIQLSSDQETEIIKGELTPAVTPVAANSLGEQFVQWIAPAVEPLGFDGTLGLAIISSFIGREAVVATLATVYSQHDPLDGGSVILHLAAYLNPQSSAQGYSLATVLSLLTFFAFAMQYVNVLPQLMEDGKRWWSPFLQLLYMTALAYGAASLIFWLVK